MFNPAGQATRGIVALQEDRIVASSVGLPTRTWFSGEERTCVQWVDLMVHPDLRRGLGGQRLHKQVAEAFFERYGSGQSDLMHHGWPIAPARRFGRRFLKYEFVREELCLVRECSGELPAAPTGLVAEPLSDVGEDLRWLWDRCASEWGLATIRDEAWARWRFLEHPTVKYRLLGVRDGGHLRGFAVLRESDWFWPGAMALCDWLVPDGEPAVAAALEHGALACAKSLGAERVVTLLPEFSGSFRSFQEQGWRVQATPYQWLVRSFDRRLDGAWLHRHGWFTLADSDLA